MSETHKMSELNVELIAITPDAERVIEQAGRTCYLSFDRIGAHTQKEFIQRLLKMGHESPLEHAYATFRIQNCSRAMTHQLVRHRLMAVSQQSQRYVSEQAFEYVVPEAMPQEYVADFHTDMQTIQAMYTNGVIEDCEKRTPDLCCPMLVPVRSWYLPIFVNGDTSSG